jgi:hypothetical protein
MTGGRFEVVLFFYSQGILWTISKLRTASPRTRRGLIHVVCFGSWAMASPPWMRSMFGDASAKRAAVFREFVVRTMSPVPNLAKVAI